MNEAAGSDNQRDIGSTRGTFEISVKFLQNSTWQGQIHWVEKDLKQNFRSALEMLKLMDEALADDNEGDRITNWQTKKGTTTLGSIKTNDPTKEAEKRLE